MLSLTGLASPPPFPVCCGIKWSLPSTDYNLWTRAGGDLHRSQGSLPNESILYNINNAPSPDNKTGAD